MALRGGLWPEHRGDVKDLISLACGLLGAAVCRVK